MTHQIDKAELIKHIDTAIAMLPLYRESAWQREPDNTGCDIAFLRAYLVNLRARVTNGELRSG